MPWPDCAIVVGQGRAQLAVVRPNSYWEAPPEPDWPHLSGALDIVEVKDADHLEDLIGPGRWAFVGHDPQVGASLGRCPASRVASRWISLKKAGTVITALLTA